MSSHLKASVQTYPQNVFAVSRRRGRQRSNLTHHTSLRDNRSNPVIMQCFGFDIPMVAGYNDSVSRGSNSAEEFLPSKQGVAGSNPVSRSI